MKGCSAYINSPAIINVEAVKRNKTFDNFVVNSIFLKDIEYNIFRNFDIPDLKNFSASCKQFYNTLNDPDNPVWKKIAVSLGQPCSIEVKKYIIDIKKKIDICIKNSNFSPRVLREINYYLKSDAIYNIQVLEEVLMARDCQLVWQVLAKMIDSDDYYKLSDFDSINDLLEEQAGFDIWCEENVAQLAQIDELDLEDKQLNFLPPEIYYLRQLEYLYLCHNHLSELPADIEHLNHLRVLDLESNHLSEVPIEIANLKKLEVLYLGRNQLSLLPSEIQHLRSLKELFVNSNKLTALPEEIGRLTKLKKFSFELNKIQEIPSVFKQLENLNFLNIDKNEISEIPLEVQQLNGLEIKGIKTNRIDLNSIIGAIRFFNPLRPS